MNTEKLIRAISTRIVIYPTRDEYNGRHWRVADTHWTGTTIYEEVAATHERAIARAHDFRAALGRAIPIVSLKGGFHEIS